MSDDNADTVPRIDSREAFVAAVRWGFERAAADGARTITCVDTNFESWPLDDPRLLQGLTAWLRQPMRQLVLLAARYDDVIYRFDTASGDVQQVKVGKEPHGLTVWPQPGRYSLGHTGNMR